MIQTPSKLQESSEVRIGHHLNENEEEFVNRRIQTVQQCLERNGIPCNPREVPKIALLGSGGGERAMLGLLGSLDKLKKTDLLDCIMYLSGVSGSTWCMASVYQEEDWSTKLDSVKEKIIQKLSGAGVSWADAYLKLKKYYDEKNYILSLTDVWAVLLVTAYVKEIDEHTLSKQQGLHDKDPFPIYTVIDKQCKQLQEGDKYPWFEFTPNESGYSLIGAFVNTSRFGSEFNDGVRINDQPEMDMLYLQALCGSALADEQTIIQFLWEKIKELIHYIFHGQKNKYELTKNAYIATAETTSPPVEDSYQVLMDLVEVNLLVLKGEDTSKLKQSINTKLKELSGGCTVNKTFSGTKLNTAGKTEAEKHMMYFTMDACTTLKEVWNNYGSFLSGRGLILRIVMCMYESIWGRKHNFIYNIKDERLPSILCESETRDYEDAGLLLNSPYFSVLRQERDVDLIISLDFSDGDPFLTVKTAAEICKKLNIPFPDVVIPPDYHQTPKDFYVFEDTNGDAPTVIHIPLFNTVNCADKGVDWYRKEYSTFQLPYSPEMIEPLLEVAGKNITNNRSKLMDEIRKVIGSPVAER